MRKIIAALQVSVDGFIEGPNGEMDWAMMEDEETWKDVFEMLAHIDTFILGRKMYPGYEQTWLAVLADPGGILSLSGRVASKNDIAYARLADSRHHIVLSSTLDKVAWKTTQIVRDVEDIRKMKQQPGKDLVLFAGADIASTLLQLSLIDEYRIIVNPVVLSNGKPFFKDIKERLSLKLLNTKKFNCGNVILYYQPVK